MRHFMPHEDGLLAARQSGVDLVALVVNNDGGGIFEFLEVAERVARTEFEAAWGTPHGLDFAAAARAFGVPPFMIGHNEKTTSWGSGVEAMGIEQHLHPDEDQHE